MDTITHALTGAVIAKAIDDQKIGNWGTIAGAAMGLFPDSDFLLGLINRQFYIEYHRDFTHSLFLIPFYALFFSWVLMKISGRSHFLSFYKICLPVLLSHVVLDLLTSYGTMVLSPFFGDRFAWDLVFIIDLTFSGIVALSILVSLLLKRKARWVCRGSVAALALYVFFCWVQHEGAIKVAQRFAEGLDEEVIQVAALPQPLSPFRWANYVETNQRVYQGFVDLSRNEPPAVNRWRGLLSEIPFFQRMKRFDRLYQPPERIEYRLWEKKVNSPWVEKALATEGVRFYYWFARFPVIRSVNSKDGIHRVEFADVRFLLPGVRMPFAYYVEFDDVGEVRSQGFQE